MKLYILDDHWNPVLAPDMLTWGLWYEERQRAGTLHVADEMVGDVRVSTVFLGIDHGYGGEPLFFETMVFGGDLDESQRRYATREQAEAGHREMVEQVKETQA